MITTNRYHHTRGFPPIAAPPWLYNLYHQSILIVILIFSTLFAQPFASYSSVTTILGSFHFLAHRDTSPPTSSPSNAILHQFFKQTLPPIDLHPRENNPTHYIPSVNVPFFSYLPHLFHHPAPIVTCQHHLLLHT
jgi:hypothetical protein